MKGWLGETMEKRLGRFWCMEGRAGCAAEERTTFLKKECVTLFYIKSERANSRGGGYAVSTSQISQCYVDTCFVF